MFLNSVSNSAASSFTGKLFRRLYSIEHTFSIVIWKRSKSVGHIQLGPTFSNANFLVHSQDLTIKGSILVFCELLLDDYLLKSRIELLAYGRT